MLEVFITGKGPLQAAFELKLSSHTWTTIRIATMWLPYHDYAELLGSADVGVSMHRSSSGLDIPMKIVDMVGAGIPNILSFEYPAISETLDFKVSLFKDSHGLCMLISNIVQAIGNQKLDEKKPLYSTLRMDSQSRNSNKGDWHHHWTNVVKPLLN